MSRFMYMDLLVFILVLVILIYLWPTVPAILKTVIGIVVGLIILFWLLGVLGIADMSRLRF